MTYTVLLTGSATRDLNAAAAAIAEHAPEASNRWFNGFIAAIETLSRDALIYSRAPESHSTDCDIRQFIYRTKSRRANRAVYTIRGNTVYILAIRRPGQDLLTDDELREAISDIE